MHLWFLKIILVFLTLSACKEYAIVETRGKHVFIQLPEAGVDDVEEVKWRVGPRRKQRVSRGVTVEMKFPLIHPTDLTEIINKHKVDSWLIQVRKISLMGSEVRGRFFMPLIVPSSVPGSPFTVRQVERTSFDLFYSAAAQSQRFAELSCPIFNHRKLITEVDMITKLTPEQVLVLGKRNEERILPAVKKYEDDSLAVDGGMALEGEYLLEYALYRSSTKSKLSNFVYFGTMIKVGKEELVKLTGCKSYKIPEVQDNRKIDRFQFGR